MDQRGHYLTTGNIAKLCDCSQRTVSKWIDSGKLKGSRIPLSSERRVHRDDLIAFFRSHDMSREIALVSPDAAFEKVLLLGLLTDTSDALTAAIDGKPIVLLPSSRSVEAGALWNKHSPTTVVIDFRIGSIEARSAAYWFGEAEPATRIAGLVPEDCSIRIAKEWPEFSAVMQQPVQADQIADWLLGKQPS